MSNFEEKFNNVVSPLVGGGARAKLKHLRVMWGTEKTESIDVSKPPEMIQVRRLGVTPPKLQLWCRIGQSDKDDTMYEMKEERTDGAP